MLQIVKGMRKMQPDYSCIGKLVTDPNVNLIRSTLRFLCSDKLGSRDGLHRYLTRKVLSFPHPWCALHLLQPLLSGAMAGWWRGDWENEGVKLRAGRVGLGKRFTIHIWVQMNKSDMCLKSLTSCFYFGDCSKNLCGSSKLWRIHLFIQLHHFKNQFIINFYPAKNLQEDIALGPFTENTIWRWLNGVLFDLLTASVNADSEWSSSFKTTALQWMSASILSR